MTDERCNKGPRGTRPPAGLKLELLWVIVDVLPRGHGVSQWMEKICMKLY